MRILGIDPGIAIVGFGIIDYEGNRSLPIQFGTIETKAKEKEEKRLTQIYESMVELINRYQPEMLAIEKLYFNRNVTNAFMVGQARGVIVLAAVQHNMSVYEYTPLQVKQAVVGFGQAEKKQVQDMVKIFLNLPQIPKPDDVADALAVAICHAHSHRLIEIIKR